MQRSTASSTLLLHAAAHASADTPPRSIAPGYYPNLIELYADSGVALEPFSWEFSCMQHPHAQPSAPPGAQPQGDQPRGRSGEAQAAAAAGEAAAAAERAHLCCGVVGGRLLPVRAQSWVGAARSVWVALR